MNKALHLKLKQLVTIFLSIILALSVFTVMTFSLSAKAEEDTFTPLESVTMPITNNQFRDSSSGSSPASPDGWTGAAVAESGNASGVKSGVMDLATYSANIDKYLLEEDYPEEFPTINGKAVSPDSPFGEGSSYDGTNKKVLMINARPDTHGTAYGYTSSSLTFDANKFYQVSAYVRTGMFKDNTGAAIRLNGLGADVGFNKINTVKSLAGKTKAELENANYGWTEDVNYGWSLYSFYIATSSFGTKTVTLSLQVGDRYVDEKEKSNSYYSPAYGYALFDNISAYEISPTRFYDVKNTDAKSNVLVKDFSSVSDSEFINSDLYNWDFTANDEGSPLKWSRVGEDFSNVKPFIYKNDVFVSSDKGSYKELFNLKNDPYSSLSTYKGDRSILGISSYNGTDFVKISAGFRSNNFTIQRYKYYRVSAWVKSQDIVGDSGATLVLHSERNPENSKNNLDAKIAACVGDSANTSRGGWKQYSFYIAGSAFGDYSASLELRLGTDGGESSGIAMFDNITIQTLTPAEFNDNKSNGTAVNFDTDAGSDGAPYRTLPNTGVTNGSFYNIGAYTDYAFPIIPSDWSSYDASTVGTTAYATDSAYLATDKVISGIIPTDASHFDANRKFYGENVINPRPTTGQNVLLISSSEKTAFCYRSPNITVTADKPGKISVSMYVDNVTTNGANLVLKSGTKVIASIEKIQDTHGFKTFNFYVEPKSVDVTDISVEIWLGLNDRVNNSTKLSSGNIYVQNVSYAALAETDPSFENRQTSYVNARNLGIVGNEATYSFKTDSFNDYDYYDNSFIKYPYNWTASISGNANTVHYGIFNPNRREGNNTSIIPSTYKNDKKFANNNVLTIVNSYKAATKLSSNRKYALVAETFYKVEVTLKVDIPEEENKNTTGATIALSGTSFKFDKILSTSVMHDVTLDKEAYQTYTFYISTGAEAAEVGVEIGLGGASVSQMSSGIVYVNNILFTDIQAESFKTNTTDIADNKYVIKAVLAEDKKEEEPTTPAEKTPLQWWLIPSILFAVAILIALVGFAVRKIMEKRSKKIKYEKTVSYDREATLNKDFNAKPENTDKIKSVDTSTTTADTNYDEFDENATPILPKHILDKQNQQNNTEVIADGVVSETADTAETSATTETTQATDSVKQEETKPAEQSKPSPTDAYEDKFDD